MPASEKCHEKEQEELDDDDGCTGRSLWCATKYYTFNGVWVGGWPVGLFVGWMAVENYHCPSGFGAHNGTTTAAGAAPAPTPPDVHVEETLISIPTEPMMMMMLLPSTIYLWPSSLSVFTYVSCCCCHCSAASTAAVSCCFERHTRSTG